MGVGRYRPPLRDRPSHRLWNRDQAVVGASKTIFSLDLLALQAAIPCRVRDHEDILPVTSPDQTKKLAGAQRAETGNQKDGPVAGRWQTGKQFGVPLHWKDRFIPLLNFRDHSLSGNISFQDILVHGLRQCGLNEIAHVVHHGVGVTFYGQPV
jgi:hypothetical protein